MNQTVKHVDRILLAIVITLTVVGFLIFISASLGLVAREGAQFSSVALNQLLFGLVGGFVAMFLTSQIHYRHWRKYAFYVFIAGIAFTLLVFVDGIGFTHGGASRWVVIGGFSVQPAEFLKIAFIIYMATFLSGIHKNIDQFKTGTLPFIGITSIVAAITLAQPDTDTFILMGTAAAAMFLTAGGRWRDILIIGVVAILVLVVLAFSRPYVMDRLTTFIQPDHDPRGSSYQLQQSLIAVGSGGWTGRGFGQSVQKFGFLPEPIGDSVFAVYSEEFGFIGGVVLILLLSAFTFRGYRIATHAQDVFGMTLVVGIMTIIAVQAFLNIGSMIGVMPVMGLPLPFVSHGGTALFTVLAAVGIVLNVSKYQKRVI